MRKAKRDFTWSKEGRNLEQFISAAGALFVPLCNQSFPMYMPKRTEREREKPNGKQPKCKHFLPVSALVPETTYKASPLAVSRYLTYMWKIHMLRVVQ